MLRSRRLALPAALAGLLVASPAAGAVTPVAKPPKVKDNPVFSPGARSGGDILFPQIGNGGYDATHYDLSLRYDPATRTLQGVAAMTATATQNLSQLSMDLQGFEVSSVTVARAGNNGTDAATFTREVPAAASANAEDVASKLVITPRVALHEGREFTVTVTYAGEPQTITDPDGSQEGWFFTDTGGVVVCQPIGCQGVYPSNNVPTDKATFDFALDVPEGMTGIANGELAGTSTAGGRTVWRWSMDQPIPTYLTTATVGQYELQQGTDSAGRPIYNFIDLAANGSRGAFTPAQRATLAANLARQEPTVDWLTGIFGPYPFGSYGAIVANAANMGYALEVATKPVYPSATTGIGTHTHELLHQWIGDSVTYAQIQDMWIHEGFATWITWKWAHERNGDARTTADRFLATYDARNGAYWELAPATPAAHQIFATQVYERGGMTLEALRQVIGDEAFSTLLRTLADRYRYGSISTAQFVALAEEVSGRDLDRFFADWLYGTVKPPLPSAYTG